MKIIIKALLLLLFTVLNSVFFAQKNVIPLSGQQITLNGWYITKDTSVKSLFNVPPDSLWLPVSDDLQNSIYVTGNWLIKTEFEIPKSINNNIILGLFINNLISAYEVYLDGNKISQNGVIGTNRTDELPGQFRFTRPLPLNFASVGKHILIIRISNFRNDSPWKWYFGEIEIGSYENGLTNNYKKYLQPILFFGIIVVPFIFNLFLFFARKRRPEHLLFSLICALVLLDTSVAFAPLFLNLTTTYIHSQYYFYNINTLLLSILFPTFFIYFFSFSRRLILPIVILNILVMILFTNLFSVFKIMSFLVLFISTIIIGWAVKEKKENSILILIGAAAGWISFFFNIVFFALASVMVVCVSFSIARQFTKSERTEIEARLKTSRLENELLKKNINPHFLLNTLTSIIAWLRKEPESAIKLIEALALEFRMVSQISALSLITMKQEVELCKNHLRIMNYRKKSNFTLETSGLIDNEQIPPMIFHTLIENGLTHGYENKTEGVFSFVRNESENGVQYCLSNDSEYNENEHPHASGVGLNYVKGRLEETYSGRWNFSSHHTENGWETIIDIRNK